MELWIRSQDRKLLCCPNKIFIDEYFEKNAYGRFEIRSDWGVLGIYTEQRALEVLDEIQSILMPKVLLNPKTIMPNGDIWEENGVVYQNCNAEAKWEQPDTFVYEMPTE